jgi:hypothetical protein
MILIFRIRLDVNVYLTNNLTSKDFWIRTIYVLYGVVMYIIWRKLLFKVFICLGSFRIYHGYNRKSF